MEKIIRVIGDDLYDVNEDLSKGWKVKMISAERSSGSTSSSSVCYVVLYKD